MSFLAIASYAVFRFIRSKVASSSTVSTGGNDAAAIARGVDFMLVVSRKKETGAGETTLSRLPPPMIGRA